jgi:hypothetical protein
MRIQLDTIKKTITIEEDVNLHEFYEELNAILPGGLWREFTLKVGEIRGWDIKTYTTPNSFPPDPYPPTYPQIWYTNQNGTDISLNEGIYNITI